VSGLPTAAIPVQQFVCATITVEHCAARKKEPSRQAVSLQEAKKQLSPDSIPHPLARSPSSIAQRSQLATAKKRK